MICKYLEQVVLFPKDLNYIELAELVYSRSSQKIALKELLVI